MTDQQKTPMDHSCASRTETGSGDPTDTDGGASASTAVSENVSSETARHSKPSREPTKNVGSPSVDDDRGDKESKDSENSGLADGSSSDVDVGFAESDGRDACGRDDVIEGVLESPGGSSSRVSESEESSSEDESSNETDGEADDEGGAEKDELSRARDNAALLHDQLLRVAADFENYRKRSQRDNQEASRRAKIEVLCELLPVFDDLERAVAEAERRAKLAAEDAAAAANDAATDPKTGTHVDISSSGPGRVDGVAESASEQLAAVAKGVSMVIQTFEKAIGTIGVERVKTVGEPFDPTVHEAVSTVETASVEPGLVVIEFRSGYRWGDRLLRAAMVVVSKAPKAVGVTVEP